MIFGQLSQFSGLIKALFVYTNSFITCYRLFTVQHFFLITGKSSYLFGSISSEISNAKFDQGLSTLKLIIAQCANQWLVDLNEFGRCN